jgi:hypothetical protein
MLARLRNASAVLGQNTARAHQVVANIVALGERIGANPIRRRPSSGSPARNSALHSPIWLNRPLRMCCGPNG